MQNPEPANEVVLPPDSANERTTVCDYCVVGCGYKVYTWPAAEAGAAQKNALQAEFPVDQLSGDWISPEMVNECVVGGEPHKVAVIPDSGARVVNPDGNHSVRGACLAKKVYNPFGATKDRLSQPLLRVAGELKPISWDTAFEIMAGVSRHVLANFGQAAWGMKTYSYQYFENTYAISKLAFESIKTPAYAPHDKPGPGNDTAGIDDTGIVTFSASYDDWGQSEVIFISGCDPYETKTVLFTDWMMREGQRLIMVAPRRTTGMAYAEKHGGLFLQIIPGTDAILHLALARIILENDWQDQAFIDQWVANRWEIDSGFGRGTRNTPWQWRTTWGKLGASFDEYREWLFAQPESALREAAKTTGIPADKIEAAAEMMAKPIDGKQPKTSFALEKGNYWSNNYLNTASLGTLGVICGAGNRPGRVISRLGGHQRGWYGAASYPRIYSPEKGPGRRKKEIDLDRWVESGNLRFAWVIGTTWCQAMAASEELAKRFREMTRENVHQVQRDDTDHAIETLQRRTDAGGMVVIDQDIYLRDPIGSELSDLVLPAATWGEDDFTRCNGERRLRLYSKFCDAPGDAKPDWWIIAQFAQRMGFKGYEWQDSNEVFEQAARFGRQNMLNYQPLVYYAKLCGKKGHELLSELGTHGIQTPVRYRLELTEPKEYRDYAGTYNHPDVPGAIVGTKRLHDVAMEFGVPEGPTVHMKWLHAFNSHTGKALLHKTPWELFGDYYERIKPQGDELWVTCGRVNEIWQTMFDDQRKPYIMRRWPKQWVEIHPEDAESRGIESGDLVQVVNEDVLIQRSGFVAVHGRDSSYTALNENGHIRIGRGECEGVAVVTSAIRPGVIWTNALFPSSPANSLIHRVPDPITNRYRFKLGKGRLSKIGESEYKSDMSRMSFAPRDVVV